MPAAFRTIAVATLAVMTFGGCRAHQLQQDQDAIRIAVMDMYTNQIMDNLVRAHNGYPFVQMQYQDITGTVGNDGSIGAGVADVGSRLMDITFGGSQRNVLTVTANPVTDNDAVYLAFLDFVRPQAGNFFCTCDPPPCGAAHMSVCCDGMYYWVPADKKHEFLRLALSTSVMSKGGGIKIPESHISNISEVSELTTTPPEYATHKIDQQFIDNNKKAHKGDISGLSIDFRVKFEDYLPAGPGTLTAEIDGKEYSFNVDRLNSNETKSGQGDVLKDGEQTQYLKVTWRYQDHEFPAARLAEALPGQKVKVNIKGHRPGFGTTGDVLNAIQHEMQLFRIDSQLRR